VGGLGGAPASSQLELGGSRDPWSEGTALIRAIEAWGRNAEARMIWLDTHLTNAAARGLYGAIGYREVGVELVKEL